MGYVEHLLLGLEGGRNPPLKKMIATCKHFAGYDMEIWVGCTIICGNILILSANA